MKLEGNYTIDYVKNNRLWVECVSEYQVLKLKEAFGIINITKTPLSRLCCYYYSYDLLNDEGLGIKAHYKFQNVMPETGFIEFSQVIFPEDEVKETRIRTGRYFAPYDMYNRSTKKGDCVSKHKNFNYYIVNDNTISFPTEWVEKEWEPEYGEEKIMIGEHEARFDNDNIFIGIVGVPKNFFIQIKYLMIHFGLKPLEFKNGGNPLTLETINKILERLNK